MVWTLQEPYVPLTSAYAISFFYASCLLLCQTFA